MQVRRWLKWWALIGMAIPLAVFATPAGGLWAPSAEGGSGCALPPTLVSALCPPMFLTMMIGVPLTPLDIYMMALVVALSMVWYVCLGFGAWPIWHYFRFGSAPPARKWIIAWALAGLVIPVLVLLYIAFNGEKPSDAEYYWPTFWFGFALDSFSPFEAYNVSLYVAMVLGNVALYWIIGLITCGIWRHFRRHRVAHQ